MITYGWCHGPIDCGVKTINLVHLCTNYPSCLFNTTTGQNRRQIVSFSISDYFYITKSSGRPDSVRPVSDFTTPNSTFISSIPVSSYVKEPSDPSLPLNPQPKLEDFIKFDGCRADKDRMNQKT